MRELNIRKDIVEACREMNRSGINQGTSGNISVRLDDVMLITPSATPYDRMQPTDIAAMPLERDYGTWSGPLKPSVEWRFHLDILRSRGDVNSVVHAHATYCTILAIARRPIPACHYMIAAFGGPDIRVGDYARYGTAELSEAALRALDGRMACLLANHGMIALGTSLPKAMWGAIELETLAKQYYHSLLIGGPVLLPDEEIAGVGEAMKGYGLQDPPKPLPAGAGDTTAGS